MTVNVISGLIRRRRDLAGDMMELLARADALAVDIEALDRTLRIFDPAIALDTLPVRQRVPKPDWAVAGEVVRIVCDTLRKTAEPLTTEAITAEVNQRRGIEGGVTALHLKRVRKCLERQFARGTLARDRVNGVICWRLAG